MGNVCIKSGNSLDGRLALEEVAGVSCDDRLLVNPVLTADDMPQITNNYWL